MKKSVHVSELTFSVPSLSRALAVSYFEFQLDILTKLAEHIVHIDGVVGSSSTVTTTPKLLWIKGFIFLTSPRGVLPRGVLSRYEQLGEHELSTLSGWLTCRNRRGGFVGRMTIINAYIRLIAMAVSRFQNKRRLSHKAYKYSPLSMHSYQWYTH